MSPVPRRWAAAAFLICCSLLAITDRASALPGAHAEAALGVIHDDTTFFEKRWQDPHPGSKAYVGFHERGVLDLVRRDCLPNGTNFCFGDSVNFCSNCGTCCTDGLYCCGSGGICCGGGCCASGQTCDQGRCLSADGPVTVTAVAFQTITHIATQTATVLVVVVDTSTIVQTTETTISNAETQTNTVWITTTAVEKRSLPTLEPELVKRGDDILVEPRLSWTEALRAAWTSVSARRLPHAIHDVMERRQATREPSAAVAPNTVTVFATETVDFTSVVSTTITQQTTSFVMTTVIMTNTIVLNARTTIDVTSTVTITSRLPVTQVITTTQSPVIITGTITAPPNRPPTTGATSSSTPTIIVPPPAASSSSIQTSAIVGIAVGGTVAAIIVASIVIFFIRHRRKHASSLNPNADLPPDVNELDREPTFPVLTHFAPTATAAHHASGDFTPPAGQYLVPNTSTKTTPSPGGSHHRSSSNYSTLVSTPYADASGSSGGLNKNYRVSAMTAASATGSGTGEVVHEMDTARPNSENPSPGTNTNPSLGTRSPPPPIPPPRNPYRGFTSHIVQTEPGELDSNEKYEIGPSRREDNSDGDDGGLLRVPGTGGIRGQRSWSEEQRYDGDGYGTPDSRRSPAVPPINWGKAL